MPYNPGDRDRSGELLGQGVLSGIHSLAGGFDKMMAQREEKLKEEKFALGFKKAMKPKFKELGYGSPQEMENDNSSSVMARAQGLAASQAIEQQEGARQLNMLQLAQMRRAGAQMDSDQAGRGQFNADLTQFLSGPADVRSPMRPTEPQLTPEIMARLAARANLPIADQSQLAGMMENFARAGKLNAPEAASGWGLAPNAIEELPGGGYRVPVSPNSFQVVPPPGADRTKQPAPNYPWLLSDDEGEFMTNLRKIEDPGERDALIATRAKVNTLTGKADPLKELLANMLGGGPGQPAAAKASPAAALKYRKGQRVMQEGIEYEWDGKKMNAVSTRMVPNRASQVQRSGM